MKTTPNASGYLLYAGIVALAIVLLRRQPARWQTTLAGALVVGAALVAIYAVAYPVLVTYQTPGTWYRVPFIVNTVLLIWIGVIVAQSLPTRLQIVALVLVAMLVLPGTVRTRNLWDMRMARAEREGRFYLAHPDRLLYSEEDAWWFIMGIHELYKVPEPHYITRQFRVGDYTRAVLPLHTTIWRYNDGTFVPDNALYQLLKQENNQ